MPAVALSTLPGAGTFPTAVVPTLGSSLTVSATAQISIGPAAQGYVIGRVLDAISSNPISEVGCLIEDADRLAGFKNILLQFTTNFAAAVSLRVSVDAVTTVGVAASALITGASLNSFTAA